MYPTSEEKKELFKKFGKGEADSGSPESQVALLTERIKHLSGHLKNNKKDYVTQRNLFKLVGKRRRQLNYLMKEDIYRYREIISALKIRR